MTSPLRVGSYTDRGWIVKMHVVNDPPPCGPHHPALLCYRGEDDWGWYWADAVTRADAPGKLPAVTLPSSWRRELIKLLAQYGGNQWIAAQTGVTRAYVQRIVGNNLWPDPKEVKRRVERANGNRSLVAHYYGVHPTVIGRCLNVADKGYHYGDKKIKKFPRYLDNFRTKSELKKEANR